MIDATAPKLPDGLPTPTWRDDEYGVALYCGDCLDILPGLPKVDLVLTDPPYGIEYRTTLPNNTDWGNIENDTGEFDLSFLFDIDTEKVIFGANCFPAILPHRGRWICWYKRGVGAEKALGSPFELAWTSRTSGFDRFYKVVHGGFVNSDGGKRQHPTQKPVQLFRLILHDWPNAQVILDPFMGSGTTGVACVNLGRAFIGIEISETYFKIAVERIRQAIIDKQFGPLFATHEPAGQPDLFEGENNEPGMAKSDNDER